MSDQADTAETVVWDIETRDEDDIRRMPTNSITYRERNDLGTVRAATRADCGAPAGDLLSAHTRSDQNITLTLSSTGFTAQISEGRDAYDVAVDTDKRVQLCVQAKNGTLLGPWEISSAVAIEEQAAPPSQ